MEILPPQIVMDENYMHEISHSQISPKNFWGEIIQGTFLCIFLYFNLKKIIFLHSNFISLRMKIKFWCT